MCGIFLEVVDDRCKSSSLLPQVSKQLQQRGPDNQQRLTINQEGVLINLFASVLWTSGSTGPTAQPLCDDDDNYLMFNGDLYLDQDEVCDSKHLYEALKDLDAKCVSDHIKNLKGPHALIYIRRSQSKLWFARDILGRQSLLIHRNRQRFVLSSVASHEDVEWIELQALGVYEADLKHLFDSDESLSLNRYYQRLHVKVQNESLRRLLGLDQEEKSEKETSFSKVSTNNLVNINHPLMKNQSKAKKPKMDKNPTEMITEYIQSFSTELSHLYELLKSSVLIRCQTQPPFSHFCLNSDNKEKIAKVGILFSGGLDSAVLARIVDLVLPQNEVVDLMNVAFEQEHGFDVPDRITARKTFIELQNLSPQREFRLIEIDVAKKELCLMRQNEIKTLLKPCVTVLDDSIGCALWFAARGQGRLYKPTNDFNEDFYKSRSRVILVGSGADEQLGGYSRHRRCYDQEGYLGLQNELKLEMERISERNMGRDNRVVSCHNVVMRTPFLDENVVDFLENLDIEVKMDLDLPRGIGEKLLLRSLAFKLGLIGAAVEPKRAIQFGSRIAKMDNSKEKGNHVALRPVM